MGLKGATEPRPAIQHAFPSVPKTHVGNKGMAAVDRPVKINFGEAGATGFRTDSPQRDGPFFDVYPSPLPLPLDQLESSS